MTIALIILLYGAIAIQFALKTERETSTMPPKAFLLLVVLFPVIVPVFCIRHIVRR